MFRILFISIFITIFLQQTYSKDFNDSVKSIIKKLPDFSKIDKLNEISWDLRRTDLI
jgi:hypothetical protein